MRNRHPRFIACLATLFLCAGAAPLPAQTSNPELPAAGPGDMETVQLSPFLVQAENNQGYSSEQTLAGTRSNANMIDLSTLVTVMNSQLISDLNAPDVQHMIGVGVAGVSANQWSEDDVTIRGFRADFSMRDGVTQTAFTSTPLYDVDRVEIIKGPQSLVMGENTFIGGAINYVSRAATEKEQGDATLDWTYDLAGVSHYRADINQSGPLYISKDFTALYRITIGGAAGDQEHPEDDINQKFVGARLQLYFHKDTSLIVEAHSYWDYDQQYFDDFLIPGETGGVAELSPYSIKTFAQTTRAGNLQKAVETWAHVTSLTHLSDYDNLRVFFSYTNYNFLEAQVYGTGFTGQYTLNRAWVNYFEVDREYVGQADFLDTREFLDGMVSNTFTAGVDLRQTQTPAGETDFSNLPSIDIRGNNAAVLAGDAALAAQDLAVPYNGPTGQNEYAEVEYQYRDSYYVDDRFSAWRNRLFVSAGMRWYHSRNTSQDLTQPSGPVTETDYAPFEAENLGIVLKPMSWLSAYYSHVTTQIPLAGYGLGPTGPPFLLLPEDGKDNEVGVKLDYKYSRNLSVWGDWDHFYESLTNVRIPGLPGEVNDITGAPVVIQSAQNNSSGWELDLGARLSNEIVDTDLIVTAYRAFTSAAAQNFGQAYNAVGDTFSLLGKFTFKEGPKGLFLGASGNQVGKKYQGDYILETPNMYKIFAGYIINKNWTVQVNWDDVSNTRYPIYIDTVASVQVAPAGEISFVSKFRW